ncbi:MAG: hypothetical protein MPW14_25170 (plasmid) [Candidatus Manganitrophus sp.]|nr:hypothetical protein [Candidatus Manganitrophus sp.]MDC4228141.1 hypothetical protein [Candidatus Manganitrophus sp.]WDT73609.1 MAG: hypothetical protein MPW17_21970 [Candidatus Manganitrophus sp.]WDT82906.1 MAG: hypothetical protein MPW14_25170 [Candidatus Manganitrophus sp.]
MNGIEEEFVRHLDRDMAFHHGPVKHRHPIGRMADDQYPDWIF